MWLREDRVRFPLSQPTSENNKALHNNVKTIAVISQQKNLGEALKTVLGKAYPDTSIVIVERLRDAPQGSTIAQLGLPAYVPGTEPQLVLSVGTKMCQSQAEREAQWKTIRDKDAAMEDVLLELGNVEPYHITGSRAANNLKAELVDAKLDALEDFKAAPKSVQDYIRRLEATHPAFAKF